MAALYKVVSSARRRGTCLLTKPEVFLGSRFYSSGNGGLSEGGEEEKQKSGFAAAYELHSELKKQQDTKVYILQFLHVINTSSYFLPLYGYM